MKLRAELVLRLQEVFHGQGWSVEANEPENDRYTRFMELLLCLEEDAQNLILTLTRDFLLHETMNHYQRGVARLADRLVDVGWEQGQLLVVVPIVKPQDAGKAKSGIFSVYLFRDGFRRRGMACKAYDRPEMVSTELPDRKDAMILLVDDFIGTGTAALAAAQHFDDHLSIESDEVRVMALVAQETGIKHLEDNGVRVDSALRRGRGIRDSTSILDKNEAYRVMERIEDLVGVPATFRLGYGRSEALVSMLRCPNNTFPVYWKSPDDSRWASPFERH